MKRIENFFQSNKTPKPNKLRFFMSLKFFVDIKSLCISDTINV